MGERDASQIREVGREGTGIPSKEPSITAVHEKGGAGFCTRAGITGAARVGVVAVSMAETEETYLPERRLCGR